MTQAKTTLEKHVAIPVTLAQALLDYLATRPYGDVYTLVPGLQGAKELIITDPAPEQTNGSPDA
jgi:hypothetical protein